jgi:hypothetical protein
MFREPEHGCFCNKQMTVTLFHYGKSLKPQIDLWSDQVTVTLLV